MCNACLVNPVLIEKKITTENFHGPSKHPNDIRNGGGMAQMAKGLLCNLRFS